jgi:hypothetical protein
MNPPYYLVEDGKVTGPHSLEVLRQKADIRVISPDTHIQPAVPPDSPWYALREDAALLALLFPARPTLSLGKARFTPANAATDAASAPVDVFAMLRDNAARQSAAEREVPLPPLPPRGRRRNRDFLLIAVGGDAFAIAFWLWAGQSSVHGVFVLSFVVVLTLSLYWVLYHVVDPY